MNGKLAVKDKYSIHTAGVLGVHSNTPMVSAISSIGYILREYKQKRI